MTKNNRKQTIMITGASGFLGKELVKQLSMKNDHNLIAVTSKPEKLKQETYGANLTIINSNQWQDNMKSDVDVLINCAFPRSSNPQQLAEGILYTENLIKSAIQLNIKSIINISSQSVYSQKEKSNIDESAIVSPESLYGMTKYACERIVATLCEENMVDYSNIRLASLTGFDLEVRMTNRFVKAALKGEPIVVNGGNQKISYLDVRDAAVALIEMVNTSSKQWKKVYNLGNNEYLTLLEIVEKVKDIASDYTNKNIDVQIEEGKGSFNNLTNSNQFYSDFNWKPKINMKKSIKELFDYYSNL